MRDPRVFGVEEDEPFPEDEDPETSRLFESQPDPLSGPLLEIDAITRYGSLLKDIRRNDVAKCSRKEPSSTHSSQLISNRRLSRELERFIADPPSYISVAPIEDNIVCIN